MAKEFNPATASMEEIQAQIARIQVKKLMEEQASQEEAERQQKAVRLASAKAVMEQREKELANQNHCSHKKLNGHPNVVGCRDSNQQEVFICQACAKEFDSRSLPPELRPLPQAMGGPIIGVAI